VKLDYLDYVADIAVAGDAAVGAKGMLVQKDPGRGHSDIPAMGSATPASVALGSGDMQVVALEQETNAALIHGEEAAEEGRPYQHLATVERIPLLACEHTPRQLSVAQEEASRSLISPPAQHYQLSA
jgi:hypothetical protein